MSSPNLLDSVQLNFSSADLLALNLALGLIMYGVALDLSIADFKYLVKNPKGFFLGIFSQFLLLPFLTLLLIMLIQPPPSVALGMFLVAACPGGNVSNFLTNLAKGNTALSVSLTGFSTAFSIILTPLNFALWAGFYPPTSELLRAISLDVTDVFITVTLILGVPLLLGIVTRSYFPQKADLASKILRPLSILIFAAFVILAFKANFGLFIQHIGQIFLWVLGHNVIALAAGYLSARV